MAQRSKSPAIFFVDAYTPNEGEMGLCLEYGVLRWSSNKNDRPEVYVHSFLKPATTPNRVRWSNASVDMKISRDFIENNRDLPTIEDMIEADYLKGRSVVCFDATVEPFYSLLSNSSAVVSIVQLWNDLFADNEKALLCTSLSKMCDFIGMLPDDKENTNYTPLLKRLHQMAALWFLLEEMAKHPKSKRSMGAGGMQFNFIWPLPKTKDKWFERDVNSFKDLTDDEIKEFFSGTLADRIDWFEMSMYACDWVYHRQKNRGTEDLEGRNEMAEFIFKNVLNFKMQVWVLIYYSIYNHRLEVARQIALDKGDVRRLKSAQLENFSNFIIENLDVFLSGDQKEKLLASLIKQSFDSNGAVRFEHFDFDTLQKQYAERRSDVQKLYFTDNAPDTKLKNCYKEIRDASGRTIYRRYEVKGRGKERAAAKELVSRNLNRLYDDARNVFSDIWLTPSLKLWIQFITGCNIAEIVRTVRANDATELVDVRNSLHQILERCAYEYFVKLYNELKRIFAAMQDDNIEIPPFQFCFQGISIEVEIISAAKVGFFRRLFSFE